MTMTDGVDRADGVLHIAEQHLADVERHVSRAEEVLRIAEDRLGERERAVKAREALFGEIHNELWLIRDLAVNSLTDAKHDGMASVVRKRATALLDKIVAARK